MRDGLCPFCGRLGRWAFQYSLSLPPTGGDYEWAETDAQTECPHCTQPITARIRVDLDGSNPRLVSSPFPTLADWHTYVVGEVRVWGETHVTVRVYAFAQDLPTAEQALLTHGGAYRSWHDWRGILHLSAAGYQELNGDWLHASAAESLQYG